MQVKHLLLIAIFALTAACSSNETISENLGEAELYRQAQADLDNKSFTSARHWNPAIRSGASPNRRSLS